MAEFKLGRIRFVWKGDWSAAFTYYKDDVVRLGGKTYICQIGHVSSADFNTDLEFNPTKWNLLTDGQAFRGEWSLGEFYQLNDVVKYGGSLYICIDSHTSSNNFADGLEADSDKWSVFGEGTDWKDQWTINTRYKINDIVRYGGYTYICNLGHTSTNDIIAGLEADQSKWDIFNPGIEYKGQWNGSAFKYKLNDVVKYGPGLWICTVPHVSTSIFSDDSSNWTEFVKGIEYENSWNASTEYQTGDIVLYGGNQYISKIAHTSNLLPPVDTTNWAIFSEGFSFQSGWDINTDYKIGEVVTLAGYSYVATQDSPSITFTTTGTTSGTNVVTTTDNTGIVAGMVCRFSGTAFGDLATNTTYYVKQVISTTQITISDSLDGIVKVLPTASGNMTTVVAAHPTLTSYFSILNQGFNWKGDWTDDTEYDPGDSVIFGANAYVCVNKHRSEGDDGSTIGPQGGGANLSRPDLDSTSSYWRVLIIGSETSVLEARGDLVFFSGAGPSRLPIGNEGQILRVSASGIPEWATLGSTDHLYYVATHGVDGPAPVHGKTWDKPFRTIRYACEQVEKGPRNPNAQKLLELNRVFIQRETSKWVEYQIANNISPFSNVTVVSISDNNTLNTATAHGLTAGTKLRAKTTSSGIISERDYFVLLAGLTSTSFRLSLTSNGPEIADFTNGSGLNINLVFDFDEYKCERDVGFIIDALIYDLGHGGNVKIRGAANSYVGGLTPEETELYGTGLVNEDVESVAAIIYMESLVEKVLNQQAPSANYQILLGDNSTAVTSQYFNEDISSEEGAISTASGLLTIVTDAITAGVPDGIPARVSPNNLIRVATGRYREVLPIIVPEFTCVQGDELRSTNAGPASAGDRSLDVTDAKYSIGAIERLGNVAYEIVQGIDVTESSGNVATQSIEWPFSDQSVGTKILQLTDAIRYNIDWRLGTLATNYNNDPTGYNTSYLLGYGDARKLLKENKKFLQEETIQYITAVFPGIKYSKTICKRDVGYIVDAIVYDLTYGGNLQSITAGLAYFDGPGGSLMIDSSEKTATLNAYFNLKSLMQDIALNIVIPPRQTAVVQFRDTAGSAGAAAQIGVLIDTITEIITNGTNNAPNLSVITITGTDTLTTSSAHNLTLGDSFTSRVTSNGLIKNTKYWIVNLPSSTEFKISDSFNGSAITLTNGTSLSIVGDVIDYPPATDGVTSASSLISAAQALDSAQEDIIRAVIDDLNSVAWHTDFIVEDTGLTADDFVIYVGKHNLAHTYVSSGKVTKSDGTVLTVTGFVYNESTGFAEVTTSVNHGLEAGDIVDVEEILVSCFSQSGNLSTAIFPSGFGTQNGVTKIKYIQNKCIRDIRIILESVMFDSMLGSNLLTIKAAHSYLRSSAAEVFTLGQKTVTRRALVKARVEAQTTAGATAISASIATLMDQLDRIIFSGSIEGSRCASDSRMVDYAILQLEKNRDYLVSEIDAWIDTTYSDTVTLATASTDLFTCSDTSWMQRGTAIRFSGALIGGVNSGLTYYVQNVVSTTTFTITTTRNSNTVFDIVSDSGGSMNVSLFYDSSLCLRDVNTYIDALKYDLRYEGNYKSLYTSRYYANAALGSLEEDMFYLRDATGLRDMTLDGLTGDLLAPNAYGTSRVSAGAYASLDPGWGPEDYRTWIMTRSPYVQGLTTFGTAAIGQKIDGALHNGGNDSIVSNDFTQVISDGIGAWVANNGRAELVSVFTYYSHIGYLATEGGRIRGTNGNNSYGDFGSVAEGVDPTEDPGTAIVDNKFQFKATVGSAFADGSRFLQLEYDNAGNDYTELSWAFTGGGTGATVENDEIRDDAVFNVRLLDFEDDSSGQFGGDGYISNANTAQGGTSTSISLAATDSETSGAYIGMVVYITGGSGVGQYGRITSYNSGTKVAEVVKENGVAGWDHVISGSAILTPDASSTYVVEPRVSFTSPGFTSVNANLPAAGTWSSATFGFTNSSYTSLSGVYSGTQGIGATWTIVRNGYKYVPLIQTAGTGYSRLETIVISGTDLGGASPENDLTLTILAVDSITGGIVEIDQEGYGVGGTFVAIQSGSRQTATSKDGSTWTNNALALPSTASWTAVAYGTFNDGSSLERTDTARFVAVASGGTSAAYSTDGVTWSSSILPTSANWTSVTFGNGVFVAIASNSTTVAVSLDGEFWDNVGTLPSTGFVSVAYGRGRFMAVKPGDTGAVAYSSAGTGAWTADDLPANSTWSSVTWGNNKFVVVASDSNDGAYSLDGGQTWSAMTLGSVDGSSVSGFQQIKYGQGLFMATAYQAAVQDYSFVVTSQNGIDWTVRGVTTPNDVLNSFSGWNAIAFGNPQRTGKWAVLPKDSEQTSVWIRTGATAKGRAFVADNKIFAIRITEPGSSYDSAPTLTITDPNNLYEAPTLVRLGSGVLAQPSWISRGTGYATASAEVFTGDGYGDFFQSGAFVAVRQIKFLPVSGSNVVFDALPGRTYKLVNIVTLLGTTTGAQTAFFQVSPSISVQEASQLTHGSGVTTRIRYSQVRLTGHDFLDIGTGNFIESNYPGIPLQDPVQAQETRENNGGRVFFTSTDQDGNFRVGDLFSIEQSTGIATLNADAFNISGLQELNLGNVTLGGGSATITEFSTDPFFTADSDSVVPTQRAIKAYISSQIGGGGAALNVNSITAGSIKISSNTIENITDSPIIMNATFEFRGGVIGIPIAFNYFLK